MKADTPGVEGRGMPDRNTRVRGDITFRSSISLFVSGPISPRVTAATVVLGAISRFFVLVFPYSVRRPAETLVSSSKRKHLTERARSLSPPPLLLARRRFHPGGRGIATTLRR